MIQVFSEQDRNLDSRAGNAASAMNTVNQAEDVVLCKQLPNEFARSQTINNHKGKLKLHNTPGFNPSGFGESPVANPRGEEIKIHDDNPNQDTGLQNKLSSMLNEISGLQSKLDNSKLNMG